MLANATNQDLGTLHAQALAEYASFRARGLKLDMTRGKPSPEQLDLSNAMLALPGNGDYFAQSGEDARNYGNLQGLAEARSLFAPLLQAPSDQIVIGDNSSLALMHDCIAWALLAGVPGSTSPWGKQASPAFICPVPGYDRHFGICETLGIRMLPVAMTGHGPDMDLVEDLATDPAVKGMWCVPKYSNPSGDIYSLDTARRLATMPTGAADFRLFWDNAYGAHHLTDRRHTIPDILSLTAAAGHADRAFIFASTSKMSFAGAGLAFFAGSPANLRWYLSRAFFRTIGADKLNQLRHVRFLKSFENLERHMDAQRAIIAPKFAAVTQALEAKLAGTGIARWSQPEGGYFITVDAMDGTARRVVGLARDAGIALTPAGATWPGNNDPHDRTLRLAPTFPALAEVKAASEGIAISILLAGLEMLLKR